MPPLTELAAAVQTNAGLLLAQTADRPYGAHPWMDYGYGWGHGGWFHGIFWAVVAVVVVFGVFVLIRMSKHATEDPTHAALARLCERYVNGEIDREEFQRIKRDLKEK